MSFRDQNGVFQRDSTTHTTIVAGKLIAFHYSTLINSIHNAKLTGFSVWYKIIDLVTKHV